MLLRSLVVYAKFHTNQLRAMAKPNVVFVLGGPGAGKGTQCAEIVKEFGYIHLSAGDLLRAERQKPGSEFRTEIERHIKQGSIVPVEITCSLLEQAMQEEMSQDPKKINFLIDGFPRNKDNLDGWNKQMGEKSHLKFVLFFDCSEQTCIDRCISRGAAGSGRDDDNHDSMKKRIVTYNESTKPIIEHYSKLKLVENIDAGRPITQVFEDVRRLFTAAPSPRS